MTITENSLAEIDTLNNQCKRMSIVVTKDIYNNIINICNGNISKYIRDIIYKDLVDKGLNIKHHKINEWGRRI